MDYELATVHGEGIFERLVLKQWSKLSHDVLIFTMEWSSNRGLVELGCGLPW